MSKTKRGKVYPVLQAEPFRFGAMGSLGNASCMLLRQWNFPAEYDHDRDQMHSADDDRLRSWDYEHDRACYKRHVNRHMDSWAQSASPEQIMAFLKDVLKADPEVNWTGFRILGTVNRSNGYPVYSYQLFANVSGVPVYSGEHAPNVKGYGERDAELGRWGYRRIRGGEW